MIHMNLCFDEGTGNQVMTGGFLTDTGFIWVKTLFMLIFWIIYHNVMIMNWKVKFYFSRWMFKLSEWAYFSSYDIGLNSGSSASHILVCTFLTLFFLVLLSVLYLFWGIEWINSLMKNHILSLPSDSAPEPSAPHPSQTLFSFLVSPASAVIAFYRSFMEEFLIGNRALLVEKGRYKKAGK